MGVLYVGDRSCCFLLLIQATFKDMEHGKSSKVLQSRNLDPVVTTCFKCLLSVLLEEKKLMNAAT